MVTLLHAWMKEPVMVTSFTPFKGCQRSPDSLLRQASATEAADSRWTHIRAWAQASLSAVGVFTLFLGAVLRTAHLAAGPPAMSDWGASTAHLATLFEPGSREAVLQTSNNIHGIIPLRLLHSLLRVVLILSYFSLASSEKGADHVIHAHQPPLFRPIST